jgi:predicted amidophosphoribosyltransferase
MSGEGEQVICPHCGKPVGDSDVVCPHCGEPLVGG